MALLVAHSVKALWLWTALLKMMVADLSVKMKAQKVLAAVRLAAVMAAPKAEAT